MVLTILVWAKLDWSMLKLSVTSLSINAFAAGFGWNVLALSSSLRAQPPMEFLMGI